MIERQEKDEAADSSVIKAKERDLGVYGDEFRKKKESLLLEIQERSCR